jgi:acyl-CoA synthetase (AMP-forming)/AMP-acid ligase II
MYWSYEYISQKLLPELKSEWTIKGVVEITASLLGEKVFLIDPITGHQFSYKKSNELSNQIAHSLMGLGLTKGSRVGIYMTNRPEYVFVLFATGKAGFAEVPINPNLREPEIKHMIDTAGISTVIVEPNEEFLRILSSVSAQTRVLKNVIIQGEKTNLPDFRAEVSYASDMIRSADDSNPRVEIEPADNYCIFFTSGTTGLPKGAPISHKTFVLAAKSVLATPVTRESRNYTCLPLFHANAQLYSVMGMRCLGGSLVLSDRFSPKKFWKEINDYQASYFNCIGGMMQILDAAFKPEDVPPHTAKFVIVGGTPVALWERFEEKFRVEVFEGYSMSEVPVLFGNYHPDKAKRKIGAFGKPIFHDLGRKIRVVNDNNIEIQVGVGELVQRGDEFITKGYWNAPEANKEAFDDLGWFHSGDLVRIDEDGYCYFVDRKKFMIRVAGENVSAFEVEDVINSYPAVAQSAAIPVADPLREEEIKVLIKMKEGVKTLDMEDLIRHCTTKLAPFKVPRYLEIIEEFPKTATERIQKVQLKEMEKKRQEHGWDRNQEIPEWKTKFYKSA